MMLPLPEYMATWVMKRLPPSLKKTRSPGRKSDYATSCPASYCPTGSWGRPSHLLKTKLVKQEQSSE